MIGRIRGLTTLFLVAAGGLAVAAPVPPAPPPDPLSRGYLGVTVNNGVGLVIADVYPDTPAGKAGLRTGDVIARVGTLRPLAFQQVVENICSYRPGAVVEIEVRRGSENKVFKVVLTTRPAEADVPGRIPGQPVIIPDN